MAFDYYINMEALALEVIKEKLQLLIDDILIPDGDLKEIDVGKFTSNLKNGAVIIIMLSVYVESVFNSIIRDFITGETDEIIKCNLEEKLEIIYLYFKKDKSKIKSTHFYETYRKVNRIRNEIVHNKYNHIQCSGLLWADIEGKSIINKFKLYDEFTKTKMKETYKGVIKFIELVLKDCGLKANYNCAIISCDGVHDLYNFLLENRL